MLSIILEETFTFEDEDDYKDEIINLKVFCIMLSTKYSPKRASLFFFLPKTLARLFLLT